MSRRVTETMPRRDEVPPFKRGAEAGGRSETGVLAKARQGAAKKLAKPATLTFPLEAGEGSIEMPRQTETPEGASVAPVGGFAKRVSPCQPSPSAFTSTRPPIQSPASGRKRAPRNRAHRRQPGGGKITALTREARDELEALRNISREVKTSVCENCSASLRSPLASKSLAPPHSGGGTGEDQEGSRP
ncbi:hypothetical protein EVAR_57320_1 [Eumeta japonica]|uniref:Uncharacterized protein n=1 Tax=Eumeta variegata TaxID=151549 RepID=A0A4C1ZYK4_EUMVA|nr:hypothetical protein EVAR_57320_1 [Eumeta japonica]